MDNQVLGDLLLEITSKNDWYGKVFNEEITQHWRNEALANPKITEDIFWLALNILKATAKGTYHAEDCPWKMVIMKIFA